MQINPLHKPEPWPLVVIVGPTGSGKSALAMHVAEKLDGEILCADSRTVYRGMDVGTAKPTPADQTRVRHHLLDLVLPGEAFSAATFKELALRAIDDVASRGKLPILVGGTGLYIDAVIFDYSFGKKADPAAREALVKMTTEDLIDLCQNRGIPLPANYHNKRHLVRAVELGGLLKESREIRRNTIVVGITMERATLLQRIRARTALMIQEGVLAEVERMGATYGWESEAMTGNIYRIFKEVVHGTKTLETATEEFVASDMRLAKRQMTWFKRNPHIFWSSDPVELAATIEQFAHEHGFMQDSRV